MQSQAQQGASRIKIIDNYSNKYWRLNNLYWIIDKQGQRVHFQFNEVQERLFDELWYMNIVLKARQFGVTTFVDIYFLDEVIFNPDVEAGIIAHNKEDAAKIFRRKIKYPYEQLPAGIRKWRHPTTDSKQEMAFNNNSSIYVGTSMRSGTLQYLHISEHGKICRKYPEKAEEIKTGSLNAVDAGQMVVIESTAEGAAGDFYDFCQKAEKDQGKQLTSLDFKFHFYPWFLMGEYAMDPEGITISGEMTKYFNNLERSLGVTLSPGQRAWYTKKKSLLGVKMKQEYPSTPQEAFEGAKSAFFFSRDYHVIEPRPIPDHANLYMTFDWGFARPYSTGYWWVDGDGRIYRFGELYGCVPGERDTGLRESDDKIARNIVDYERETLKIWGRSITRLCDPTCLNKKPDYKGGGQGPSTADEFAKFGIFMSPGDPSRDLKIRQFNLRLALHDDQPPMMLIYNTCVDFIRTIPLLQMDEHKPEDIDKRMEDHCFDSDTEILTNQGWRLFSELNRHETVATMTSDRKIEYQKPSRYIERQYEGEMYKYDGRINFCVTEGHRFPVISKYYQRKDKRWKHKRIDAINDDFFLPRTATWAPLLVESNLSMQLIPEPNSNANNVKELPLLAFMKYLGFWIAEGCIGKGSKTHYAVHVDQNDESEIDHIVGALGYRYQKYRTSGKCYRWSIQSKQFYQLMVNLFGGCNARKKFIPRSILNTKPELLQPLYDGLMLGDGNINRGMQTYSTTSKQLADDVQELAFKLGKCANIKRYEQKHTEILGRKIKSKVPYYRVHIHNHQEAIILKGKTHKKLYSGMVYCVTVPNETIYVRRKGTAYWSSNCYDEATLLCMAWPLAMTMPEKRKSEWDRRIEALESGHVDDYEDYAETEEKLALRNLGVNEVDFGEEAEYVDHGEMVDTIQ